jgi:hypothetical protein
MPRCFTDQRLEIAASGPATYARLIGDRSGAAWLQRPASPDTVVRHLPARPVRRHTPHSPIGLCA